ncbi:MAG: UDP-glucose 4-epimerase GalE [Pseudomonadota bacterium]
MTGGAGYIGSHAALAFMEAKYRVVILDNLSTSEREWVVPGADFVEGNVADCDLVERTIKEHGVTGVAHFAASVIVPESIANPSKYYLNNTANSALLMQTCANLGVDSFLFSSTAAVYGISAQEIVDETSPTCPENPYGKSKLMTEEMLKDISKASAMKHACLRYFNVAGADPQGRTGQRTKNATHLIKVAAETGVGLRPQMTIFGDDYPTADGTCIRDYIHVSDLAAAHVLAYQKLCEDGQNFTINCGYGKGYSVKDIITGMEKVSGKPLKAEIGPRRDGDVPCLIADSSRMQDLINWAPLYDRIDVILESAFNWEKQLLNGLAPSE